MFSVLRCYPAFAGWKGWAELSIGQAPSTWRCAWPQLNTKPN